MAPPSEQLIVKTVELKLQRYAAECRIPREAMERAYSVDTYIDHECDYLATRVTYGVYGIGDEGARKVEETVSFSVPATWWDAFKLHFAGCWWLSWYVKRNPAQYTVLSKTVSETVTARALLPDVPLRVGQHTVRFAMTGGVPAMQMPSWCGGGE